MPPHLKNNGIKLQYELYSPCGNWWLGGDQLRHPTVPCIMFYHGSSVLIIFPVEEI